MIDKHPFRVWRETGSPPEQASELLAPDIVFHSPVLAKSVSGRELVLQILLNSGQVTDAHFLDEFRQGNKTMLRLSGTVENNPLETFIFIIDNENGKVQDLTVAMRPFYSVARFREMMFERLQPILPVDVWEVTGGS